jgi:hypothetical protein
MASLSTASVISIGHCQARQSGLKPIKTQATHHWLNDPVKSGLPDSQESKSLPSFSLPGANLRHSAHNSEGQRTTSFKPAMRKKCNIMQNNEKLTRYKR